MTKSAVLVSEAQVCMPAKSVIGIAERLSAAVFGSPSPARALGGYRAPKRRRGRAHPERLERSKCLEGTNRLGPSKPCILPAANGSTPVFCVDAAHQKSEDDLPKIWLSERLPSNEAGEVQGRAFTVCYPSEADKGGLRALGLAERYFAEGINMRNEGTTEERVLQEGFPQECVLQEGVPQERIQCFQAAELMYMHAMKRGNLQACTRLGVLYRFDMCRGNYMKDALFRHGKHARHTSAKESALSLFRKAAAQGDAEAMVQLGEMLTSGEGCSANAKVAFKLFKSAIRKCTGMEFDQIECSVINAEARRRMHALLTADLSKAAIAGKAALHIAESFEGGLGARQSFETARVWYEVAYEALSTSFDYGFWYSKRNKCKARKGYLRTLQEIKGKY